LLPRLLLDTHVLIQWLFEPEKLSRTKLRGLEAAVQRGEPLAFSAMSLLETALLRAGGKLALKTSLEDFYKSIRSDPVFQMLPITYDVALEFYALGVLRDPGDRVIAATARVHRLRLVTSDECIIDSGLVPVLE
jgi:PIN domain nuclease of toxin-antitoxin system